MGFGRALESGMDPAKVRLPLGLAYLKNGDFSEAVNEFTQALESEPNNDHILFLRGMARFNRGDLTGTLEDLTLSLQINPGRGMALVARSLANRALHRTREADMDMQSALGLGGVEVELFMREYCLTPSLHNLAMSLFDVYKAPWGGSPESGSRMTH